MEISQLHYKEVNRKKLMTLEESFEGDKKATTKAYSVTILHLIMMLLLIPFIASFTMPIVLILMHISHKTAKSVFKDKEKSELYTALIYDKLFNSDGKFMSLLGINLFTPMVLFLPDVDIESGLIFWSCMGTINFIVWIAIGKKRGSSVLTDKYTHLYRLDGNLISSELNEVTSYPNKTEQLKGYKWSNIKELKAFTHGNVYINNFHTYQTTEEDTDKELISQAKKQSIEVNRLDFTRTFTVLGGMGSGKTEFFHSLLAQGAFNREIIHDIKGDFVEKWYNPELDYILNPYDERGLYWDIWEEMEDNEGLVESFITNLMQTKTEEKDFFTGSAKKVVIDMFLKVHYTVEGTSQAKWDSLLAQFDTYQGETQEDKTKGSIYATMELVLDLFSFMAWHSKQGKQSFTIGEYLESNGKLFLLNNPSVSNKLTPLFTGFTSMLTEILLSKSDTKDNLTLILLDEYISMEFEKQTRLKLLTQIRSKGGCLVMGMQYLPKKDKEHQQLIDSSSYGRLIFQLNDQETVKHIIESMGDMEYTDISTSESESYTKEGTNSSAGINYSNKTQKLLTTEHLQSMPPYTHIALFNTDKIIYLGYTPLIELEILNKNFLKLNQKAYYAQKFQSQDEREAEELARLHEADRLEKGDLI